MFRLASIFFVIFTKNLILFVIIILSEVESFAKNSTKPINIANQRQALS